MTFDDILKEVEKANRTFKFDLKWIDSKLTNSLEDFFAIKNDILNLNGLNKVSVSQKIITLAAKIKWRRGILRGRNENICEVWIVLKNNSGKTEYFISLEPNGKKWEKRLSGELDDVISVLPIKGTDILFYYTSLPDNPIDVTFDGGDSFMEILKPGISGIVTQVENAFLSQVGLGEPLFIISKPPNLPIEVYAHIKRKIPIGNLAELSLDKINIKRKGTLALTGKIKLPLFNAFLPEVQAQINITQSNYEIALKIDQTIKPAFTVFFKDVKVKDIEIQANGSFINPVQYSYGASGKLVLPGGTTGSSANGRIENESFTIRYSNTQPNPVPVFFEAYLAKITLTRLLNIVAGKKISAGTFLNKLIQLESTYVYWCNASNLLVNGIQVTPGVGFSSGVHLLGHKSFISTRLTSKSKEFIGYFETEPISLGGIVKIHGKGKGTPAGYNGQRIKKGGMVMSFRSDNKQKVFVNAAIGITLLKEIKALNVKAELNKKGLSFSFDSWDLPFADDVRFNCILGNKGTFSTKAVFKVNVLGIKIDLGPLGLLKTDIGLDCALSIKIDNYTDVTIDLIASFAFGGEKLSLTLNFSSNPDDLFKLEKILAEKIPEMLKVAARKPEQWLYEVLQKSIEFVENVLKEIEKVLKVLKEVFEQTLETVGEVLNKAGMVAEDAAKFLKQGFGAAPDQIGIALQDANYTIQQITDGVLGVVGNSAKETFRILKQLEIPEIKIGKALKKYQKELEKELKGLGINKQEVANLLKGLGKSTKQAVAILKNTFGQPDKEIRKFLKNAGFNTKEIEKQAKKAFRDVGKDDGWHKVGPVKTKKRRIIFIKI